MFGGVKVLVTGCSGFLGPWLCQRLIGVGAEVFGADVQFDAASRIHEIEKKEIELIELNVEHFDHLEATIADRGVQFVFHLAAQAIVGEALEKPLETISTNVMGTANVLEVARRLKNGPQALRGIVVASSDKAYGDQDDLPYVEDSPMMGRFPYDVSKSCADLIACSYFHSYQLPVSVMRSGNLYGGGDLNWSRIVPGTIKSLVEGKRPIVRSDGTLVRDYVYVEDAAEAFVQVGQALLKDDTVYGEAFNICNDDPLTVLEMVKAIRDVLGRNDLEPVIENSARGEIKAQYLCSKKLRDKLGWKPETSLRDGLEKTVEWYRMRCHAV